MAKLEQAHQKANILLVGDPYLDKINKIYNKKKKELEKAKNKKFFKGIFNNSFLKSISIMLPIILLVLIPYIVFESGELKLKKQVKQIESYEAEENYDAALTIAYSMSDSYSSNWTETRKNLINRIQYKKAIKDNKVQFPTEELKGRQVEDVVTVLKKTGFNNITKETVKSNFVVGLMDKIVRTSGEVKEVLVNGSTDYTIGDWIDVNAPIVVRYWE